MEMENTQASGVETTETTTEEASQKTYSEAEVTELIQREADKRVTAALKKQEHKFNQKISEAQKFATMSEEQKKEALIEQKLAEYEAKEKEWARKENLLEANKVLQDRGLPTQFAEWIVADEAETMMENITAFEKLFKAAVNDAVSLKIASPTPKSGTTAQGGITKESFKKLSSFEQQEIYRSNPQLYKQLVS
jgi:hypothetical protein